MFHSICAGNLGIVIRGNGIGSRRFVRPNSIGTRGIVSRANCSGFLLKGIKAAYRNAGSVDCAQSIINLDELTTTLNGAVIQGTAIEVGYVFKSCIELAPPQVTREQLEEVKVTIHLRSLGSDITETATF